MPIEPIKKSALPEIDTIADADYLDGIDDSAATPATKNKRFPFTKIAAWISSKFAVPSQAEAEAGEATTARLWTAERVAQAIAALAGESGLSESEVNALIAAALTAFLTDEDFETAVNALITTALEGIEGGGLTEGEVNTLITAALTAFLADEDFETAVNALITTALEGIEGGGSTLPVADTTALVKDPTDETKLIRLDAGNVPTGTTAVVQTPGVSVVAGLMVYERTIEGIAESAYPGFVATKSGHVVGFAVWQEGGSNGTYNIYLQLRKNSVDIGTPIPLSNTYGASFLKWGRGDLSASIAPGDVIDINVVSDGADDYGGSGSSGSAATGNLIVGIEVTRDPVLA